MTNAKKAKVRTIATDTVESAKKFRRNILWWIPALWNTG